MKSTKVVDRSRGVAELVGKWIGFRQLDLAWTLPALRLSLDAGPRGNISRIKNSSITSVVCLSLTRGILTTFAMVLRRWWCIYRCIFKARSMCRLLLLQMTSRRSRSEITRIGICSRWSQYARIRRKTNFRWWSLEVVRLRRRSEEIGGVKSEHLVNSMKVVSLHLCLSDLCRVCVVGHDRG